MISLLTNIIIIIYLRRATHDLAAPTCVHQSRLQSRQCPDKSKSRFIERFQSNLLYTRGITPKSVTSGGIDLRNHPVHLRDTAPKKHRSGGEPLLTVPDSISRAIELQTCRANGGIFNH